MAPDSKHAFASSTGGHDGDAALAPFRFDGGRAGVLLVHGFMGSPYEMRPLGEALAARGFSVVGVALAGHGPEWRRLRDTTWPDWYRSVEDAFDELRVRCDVVAVCGQSLGGLLTLELARQRREQVAAIATLAAAMWIAPWMTKGIRRAGRSRIGRRFVIPRWGGSDVADRVAKKLLPTKGGMPISALNQLVDAMEAITPRVGEVDRPALIVHSPHDHTIPFACAAHLAAGLAGPVEQMTLERSFHVISIDLERAAVFARVGDFFARTLALPATANALQT